ncbi:hypothetical protein [Burkholderia sp. AU45388]|uniref:hypothetical protein n=1 Tax=Burkholderia sp. AU45388 TaxID=3059206 RepID=UPI002653F129|nr:hypothetical protein [Burkholderia sp. AU45388]MDN7431387.1 hypothetical protein [Burkholderia sp. AU45388]
MLDPTAHAGWAGCVSLGPTEARLWIVKGTQYATGHDQDFSLADVLEAGFRAKITGLNAREREAVIADCIADTLAQIADMNQLVHEYANEK